MNKQYSMKVYPAGMGRDVYRNIEICGNHSLDQLCGIILKAFDFSDEHLYEFCMDSRKYSENTYQLIPEGDEPSTVGTQRGSLGWMGMLGARRMNRKGGKVR